MNEILYWCNNNNNNTDKIIHQQISTSKIYDEIIKTMSYDDYEYILKNNISLNNYIIKKYKNDLAKNSSINKLMGNNLMHYLKLPLIIDEIDNDIKEMSILSALCPNIRTKEPTGLKSKLRSYQSKYWNIKPNVINVLKQFEIENNISINGTGLYKKINIKSTNEELEKLLKNLIIEINNCRKLLIESKLY